ncbi:hypothetical protein FACS1894187_22970 [Synergistales bacterium]|nr:hypothetical protein FACS1894187_22970 [Synergistales bacterium]
MPIHWDLLQDMDPELFEKTNEWRKGIDSRSAIPEKYRELMKVATACVLRYDSAILAHAELAVAAGATKEELFSALLQSMLMGGIPAYRNAAMVLADYLKTL